MKDLSGSKKTRSKKRIPIRVARDISKEFDLSQVVLVAFDKKTGTTHVVTYGQTLDDCAQAAQGGNFVKKALGWPDDMRHDQPARVKKKTSE